MTKLYGPVSKKLYGATGRVRTGDLNFMVLKVKINNNAKKTKYIIYSDSLSPKSN